MKKIMNSFLVQHWQYFENKFLIDLKDIESKVESSEELYQGLNLDALYSSLPDLEGLFHLIEIGGDFLDLGGGVGFPALVYAQLHPDMNAFSLEKSFVRHEAGKRIKDHFNISNVFFMQADLLNCDIPDVEIYFLYFPTGFVLDRILDELVNKKRFRYLVAIESHGDLIPRLLIDGRFEVEKTFPLTAKRHLDHAYIFKKSAGLISDPTFQLSYKDLILKIQSDNDEIWLGLSKKLSWMKGNLFNLAHPPRTISSKEILEVMAESQLEEDVNFLLKIFKFNELKMITDDFICLGEIRKIIIYPEKRLEISSGQLIEWKKVKFIFWKDYLCYDAYLDYYFLPLVPWE